MEFHDMAKVCDVDPQVIARTSDWLEIGDSKIERRVLERVR